MRHLSKAALVAAVIAASGCYHATIETGRPESGQKIVRPWANGFVYGLVPPPVVETASRCPNGVARVETYHSLLNMLAQWLTFGLYSPMTIDVTCAAAGSAAAPGRTIEVGADATAAEKQAAVASAAALSATTGEPAFVRF